MRNRLFASHEENSSLHLTGMSAWSVAQLEKEQGKLWISGRFFKIFSIPIFKNKYWLWWSEYCVLFWIIEVLE
jgi:hypothetical protein